MNIVVFEENINPVILKRGYYYYKGGNISEDFEKKGNKYTFRVYGTDQYKVFVELDEYENILSSKCNCPYDLEPICKHQIAVFYKLRDLLKGEIKCENKTTHQPKNKENTLNDVLKSLDKNQLIDIIMDQIAENPKSKNSILIKYSPILDYESELKKCEEHIDSSFKMYFEEDSYIEDRSYLFALDVKEIFKRICVIENKILAMDILLLVLEKSIYYMQYIDDFDLYFYDDDYNLEFLVKDVIRMIKNVVLNIDDSETKNKILNKLLDEYEGEVLSDWHNFKMEIMDICCEIADTKELQKMLAHEIEVMIDDGSRSFLEEKELKVFLYNLIFEYAEEDEIQRFIDDNIEYPVFREIAINRCLENGEFDKAVEYATEGEKQNEFILMWKELKYEAYKKMGAIDEQKSLAKELLFKGEIKYYSELKSLSQDENFYSNFQDDLKKLKKASSRTYLEIIEMENDLDAIMEYVRKKPYAVEEYAEKLLPKYRTEVGVIYYKYLKKQAENNSNRKEYRGFCRMIEEYGNVMGQDAAMRLIEELKATYRRKRAFVDELNKII